MEDRKTYEKRWWILGVLSAALLLISLDNTILNVALPTIGEELEATSGQMQWIVDSYTLVFAGLLLTAGALGDRFGRRRALVLGLVVFGAGSLTAALSSSSGELIASRALMGVGGAFVMPTTLSILTNVFPANERAKAIGIWAAVAGLGIAVGPVAGGWLIEHFEWGSVFLVNVPVVLAALAGTAWLISESRDPSQARLDPVGAGLSIAGLTALVWAIIEAGGERGWTDGVVLAVLAGSAAILAAFVAWERRTASPMLDIALFRERSFSGAAGAIALAFFALFGTIFFLTQYLQEVLDYGAFEAGLRTTPVAVGLVIGGPLSAKLAERFGIRRIVSAGLAILGVGLMILSSADAASGYGVILAGIMVLGFGIGMAMAPATESIMSSLPAAHAGVGSAMNDATRLVGGTLGVAVLGSLLSGGYGADMEEATQGLPGPAAEAAGDSIGQASAVAGKLGGAAGNALSAASETAFASAMSTTLLVAAAAALGGALLALGVLPDRRHKAAAEPALEPVTA